VSSRLELFGVVTSYTDQILDGVPLRTLTDDVTARLGTVLHVGGSMQIYAGIERFSAGRGADGEWRFSGGVQQGLPLPLPVRRPPVVSGLIYEDVDGDGRRGPEDPALDGVTLRMGFERTTSLPGGRFEFRNADPGTVTVDARAAGDDYLPLPDLPVPADRFLEIGLTRSAGLDVSAFLDSNANGTWDAGELAAAGLRVVVRREADEGWEITTSADGTASLSSVRPGSFVVSVVEQSIPRRGFLPELQAVTVSGGERVTVLIAIPMRQIRFTRFGDAEPVCDARDDVCDDD
jgi:hypothetical protein